MDPLAEPSPDRGLVQAAQRGDRVAFGRLFERYLGLVHGVLLARVEKRDADDLVQEVFITAMNKLQQLSDPDAFGAWLARIARNRAVDHLRQSKPLNELTDEIVVDDPRRVEAEQILATIRELPDAYREPLILRLVEGMTGPEIAARTGLTPDSVRVNLHRGMKLLKKRLGQDE